MDATGAGTSTGQEAGPADVTGSAGDVTAGPSRVAGRADATGPLPVQAPADATGPLPAQQAGPWFGPGAADTAAQPVVPAAPTPSWFATGPLPVFPAAPDSAAPAPPAATGAPFDAGNAAAPSTPPAGLLEPANGAHPTAGAPTGPQPTAPVQPPPNGVPTAVEASPPPPTGPPSPEATAPAPQGGGPAEPAPPTGPVPVVGPPPPAHPGPTHAPPPAAVTPPPPGSPAGPTDLFTPAAPPPGPGTPAAAGPAAIPVPPADLFTPAAPPLAPPAPPAPEPPTGLFAAVAAPPPAVPAPPPMTPTVAPPAGGVSAPPGHPADATGPMPVINPASAPPAAAPDVTPPQAAGSPPPPAPEAPPRTDAWAFPTKPPRTESWSPPADDRRRGAAQPGPLRTPTGGGHSPSLTMVSGSKAGTGTTKRRAWPLTVVGVLVAVAAGIALVFSVARTNPADLATTAATEAGSWPGAHYQGTVAAIDGGEIRLDLTVTPDGASGTLSRDGGRATAELIADQGGALIRANREWWLYHHPTRADDLAGSWVAEPLTETQEIAPLLRLSGPALSAYVRGEQPARWQALEQQLVDGRSGIVLFDGARRVVVGGEDTHPLLAVDIAPNAQTPPVPVSRSADEEVAAVTGAAARVRQEAAPKTLAQLLQERPNVGIQLQPDPLCTAQTCNVTITVTNSGTAPARGRLEVSADGQVVANHPLDVQPGQAATFTATAPNPQFGQPEANGRIMWETRAVDD